MTPSHSTPAHRNERLWRSVAIENFCDLSSATVASGAGISREVRAVRSLQAPKSHATREASQKQGKVRPTQCVVICRFARRCLRPFVARPVRVRRIGELSAIISVIGIGGRNAQTARATAARRHDRGRLVASTVRRARYVTSQGMIGTGTCCAARRRKRSAISLAHPRARRARRQTSPAPRSKYSFSDDRRAR